MAVFRNFYRIITTALFALVVSFVIIGNTFAVSCNLGQYLSGEACIDCPVGSYSASGATACTPCQNGTTTSGTGSTSCDATCPNNANVNTWTTAIWNNGDVENMCEPNACVSPGYSMLNTDLSLWEYGSISAIGYSRLNNYVGSNEQKYGLTRGSGEWAIEFTNGAIKGMARCSTLSAGAEYNYSAAIGQIGDPANELNQENAKYCWCQITGYAPYTDNNYSEYAPVMSNAWVFSNDNDTPSNCATHCPNACAYRIQTSTLVRSHVFDIAEKTYYCAPITYTITYNIDGGTLPNGVQNPTSYTINDVPYTLPEPSKDGYDFVGWCDGTQTCDNKITTITSTNIGNKTLYAQWEENSCPAGQFYTEDGCQEAKFTITTMPLTENDKTFSFKMAAYGTFYVDWGDGVQKIVNTNTSTQTITHTFQTDGVHTIKFGGVAERNENDAGYGAQVSVIQFNISGILPDSNAKKIAAISGSLGKLFPTLNNGESDGKLQPQFIDTFKGCINLTELPTELFNNIKGNAPKMFYATFYGCTGLEEVPQNLFYNIGGTLSGETFKYTFYGCTSLKTLHSSTFKFSTRLSDREFESTFQNCTALEELPANLFYSATPSTTTMGANVFQSTFSGCTSLRTISPQLFSSIRIKKPSNYVSSYNPSYRFYRTFQNCTNLTSIPFNLFNYVSVTGILAENTFLETFSGCNNLEYITKESSSTKYIPSDFLLTLNSTNYTENAVLNMFSGTKLLTSCPENTHKITPVYDAGISPKVSCDECPNAFPNSVSGDNDTIEMCYTTCPATDEHDGTLVENPNSHKYWTSDGVGDVSSCVYKYEINYVSDGVTLSNSGPNIIGPTTYTYSETAQQITLNDLPDKEIFAFDGWCDDAELTQNCGTTKTINPGTTGSITYYAKWVCPETPDCPEHTTCSYDPESTVCGVIAVCNENEHYYGNGETCTFCDTDNTWTWDDETQTCRKTVSLLYVDNVNDEIINLLLQPDKCTYDSEFKLPDAPTKDGFEFAGWRLVVE